jgi:hypothetical protein
MTEVNTDVPQAESPAATSSGNAASVLWKPRLCEVQQVRFEIVTRTK